MTTQLLTYIFVGVSFALYIGDNNCRDYEFYYSQIRSQYCPQNETKKTKNSICIFGYDNGFKSFNALNEKKK